MDSNPTGVLEFVERQYIAASRSIEHIFSAAGTGWSSLQQLPEGTNNHQRDTSAKETGAWLWTYVTLCYIL